MVNTNQSEAPRRVVVIDDSEIDLCLMRTRLRLENILLVERMSGPEGYETAVQTLPDLVILDLEMRGWDGFETIRRLKEDPRTKGIPVIFMSERDDPKLRAKGLDLGAMDFVTKPFDPVELRARIRVGLRSKYLLDLLESRAHLDGLTGLGNRIAMQERLDAEWMHCHQRDVPIAFMIADLDHFKQINDRYGHSAGDEILRSAAQTLNASVRSTDFVARYGGEEFVVIAPDCDLEGAYSLAERFRLELAGRPLQFGKLDIKVTTSLGITSTQADPENSPKGLIEEADQALYKAKSSGRNAVWAWNRGRSSPVSFSHSCYALH